jgi:PAS domain S-box-containing protein
MPRAGEEMEKETILIIDDDPNIRKTLCDILKAKGYDASAASNGTEGIEVLKRSPVHMVVIDLGLPDMPGLEVLSRMKAGYPFTEAIILTGNSSIDVAIEATNRGAFSFLLKPYDMEQLLLCIRRALEKQKIGETLRKSEERYRLLAENAHDTIWAIDLSGRVTYISPSVFRLRGYTPEEVMGQTLLEAIAPSSELIARKEMEELLSKAARGEPVETRMYELELIHKDGRIIWAEVTVIGMYGASGRLIGIQGVSHDITERKRAEEERNKLIADLKDAFARIRTLSGLLPICSGCKKIRDDKGAWEHIEVYIRNHSEADFSHGICPECLNRLYPGLAEEEV